LNAHAAARRRHRAAAIATLLLLHGAAIEGLLHWPVTRDRDRALERITLLRLLPMPRRPETAPALPPPRGAVAPRPLLAPLPWLDPELTAERRADAPLATASTSVAQAPAASAPLDLKIPRSFFDAKPPALTPAQEAMRDPRSNHLELTHQEKLDIAFGAIECIAWQREPDGSIYRGPGHYRRVSDVSTNAFTSHRPGSEDRPMECVK